MENIKLVIDEIEVEVEKGTTVLEAARMVGIKIPSLCYLNGINHPSSCRVCVVEAGTKLAASCTLAAEPGMIIKTNTPKVRNARRTSVELLLSNHKIECPICNRNQKCELQAITNELNIDRISYEGIKTKSDIDHSSFSVVRDAEKCILCGRCVSTCQDIQTVSAIGFANRGFKTLISTAFNKPLGESVCINCGQCILACPVGALYERDSIKDVWRQISDSSKYVVVQTAPAVRVALGEEFGMPIGTSVTGKMVAALKRLGFDKVFDTDFAADLTIMEEGTELITRLKQSEKLPLMTSCCPGWVKFVEHYYPELLNHLSTCKSPHEMEGALIKSYFSKKMGVNPENIVVVSIMPCTAKKFENNRDELSGVYRDVDYVLTTRELAKMIKEQGIDFVNITEECFDNPFGESTGAAILFGTTGGVCEAALRTAYELLSGQELKIVEFEAVRGTSGIREATIELPTGQSIKTAVVSGLGNARKLLDAIKEGETNYQFIEVMACPGGCVNGGGQPIVAREIREQIDIKQARAKAIYNEDEVHIIRKSHENPYIKKIYEDYLIKPNSKIAHDLLHTYYIKRDRF